MANKLKELIGDSVFEDGKLALGNLKDSIMNYSDENSDNDNTESSDCDKPVNGSGAAEHRKQRSEFNGPGQKPPVPGFKHHGGKRGQGRRRREQEM